MQDACDILIDRAGFKPRWLIELGSGFDKLSHLLAEVNCISYSNLPGFRLPTTPGHSGVVRFYHGSNGGAFAFLGRSHLYEGISPTDAAMIVQIAARIGVEGLILCSACGGIAEHFQGHLEPRFY